MWRVVCRDPGAGDLGGCTKEVLGKRHSARGEVSAKLSNGGGMGYCSALESSSSESMSGGSGSSKNVGRPLPTQRVLL